MTSQAGGMSSRPAARVDPYSKVVLNDGSLGLCGVAYNTTNDQNQMININSTYNISPQEFNIPVSNSKYPQYITNSPYSDSQSPYTISQPSPDSQGLANMNIADPIIDQNNLDAISIDQMLGSSAGPSDQDVNNLSGKIG